jgi:hypothetical protein
MFRYPDALENVEAAIKKRAVKRGVPDWLKLAAERTSLFKDLGRYTEEFTDQNGKRKKLYPFWGDIKLFYMQHQHNKCIYCEL